MIRSFLLNSSAAQLRQAEAALLKRAGVPFMQRLVRLRDAGDNTMNTVMLGTPRAPPLVLVHGYGAA